MKSFFLGPFLEYLPEVFFWLIFVFALFYFWKARFLSYRFLVKAVIFFHIIYALILSAGQYWLWASDGFSKLFFEEGLGYFLFYSWSRFWFRAFLAIGFGILFWLFLKFLEKRNERFFHKGETELGFLCALMVGWPEAIIFLALTFVFVVLVSCFRIIFLGEAYTTLGVPFLLSTLTILATGNWLIILLGLEVLRI